MSTSNHPPPIELEGAVSGGPSEPLTIEEMIDRYHDEWIVMEVTEHDVDYWPSAGRVLIRSPRQSEIVNLLNSRPPGWLASFREQGGPLSWFQASASERTGAKYEEAVKRLIADFAVAEGETGERFNR